MKRLYLLRHAKSSWENSEISDFNRPLNEKGYDDAENMSQQLHKMKIGFDIIVSSPAIRAISTAMIFARNLKYKPDEILIKEQLYESGVNDYLKCISTFPGKDSVLLVGHNNTISEVSKKLYGGLFKDLK